MTYARIVPGPVFRPILDDLSGLRAEMRRVAQFAADAASRPEAIKSDAALREVALRIERALGDKRL